MVRTVSIDGGGSVATTGPSSKPQTHEVASGETLAQVADRYGVTPQAIRRANPQIFQDTSPRRLDHEQQTGELIWMGDVLNIPPADESVLHDEPLSSDYNPLYASSNSEFSVSAQGEHTGGAITWNPGDGTVKLSTNAEQGASVEHRPTPFGIPDAKAAGVTFEAKVVGDRAHTYGPAKNKDGNTEFSLEWDTSITARAGGRVDGRGMHEVGGERSVGAGFQSRYKVVLPGENRKQGDADKINPYDPTSIPVGATVTMDSQQYTTTGMSASFEHIGTETNVKDASGTSYSVTRVDNGHVRVTMGPNEAVEAFNGVGVSTDVATVMLGKQAGVGSSTVRTATFDLTNKDGQAAYAHFTATGEVADRTPGVSDVATIERIDYSSQTRLKLGLGPEALRVQADLAGPQDTGAFVKTTYPDGSYAYTTNLQYSGNVPLQVTQRFDATGNEVVSERTYQFKVSTARDDVGQERELAGYLNMSFYGGQTGPIQPGETATITFNEAQMTDFRSQALAASAANDAGTDPLDTLVSGYDGQPVDNLGFAARLARNLGGDPYGFSQKMFIISGSSDGDVYNGQQLISADVKSG